MGDFEDGHGVEHHWTRSVVVVVGVLGLLVVAAGACSGATSQVPRTVAGRTVPPVKLETATVPPPRTAPASSASAIPASARSAAPARPSSGCTNPTGSQAPGTSDVPIVSRGERRSYLRTIPMGAEPAPAPLVVVLDDGSGDPSQFVARAHWGAVAQSRHFVLAAPRWTRADDDQLAADTIVDIDKATCVDLARVYLAGFSTGAMLGSRVVCRHPGLVTAFVAVAGLPAPDGCSADEHVPVLVIGGARDQAVAPPSVVAAARAWARQDRCQAEPASQIVAWTSSFSEFELCADAVDVQLYLLSDAGHEWPEPIDDLASATRWADVIDTTTIAVAFCDTYGA